LSEKSLKVRVMRFIPSDSGVPTASTYEVPYVDGMSVMDVLDHIYENLDRTVAYFDHAACNQGICRHCSLVINGTVGLACETLVSGDLTLEPLPGQQTVRDLVYKKREGREG
jgi:succinate dehydrogenase/fumarate reductase-like Fe-S protein